MSLLIIGLIIFAVIVMGDRPTDRQDLNDHAARDHRPKAQRW